ncbi:MAG TPA: ubiquinol oxidase subunit II [Candidatus Saccharimonadales bacterium]|nr:ubiquinol oxidase subunit II [Candidatus Saccharimonadales bacterium]
MRVKQRRLAGLAIAVLAVIVGVIALVIYLSHHDIAILQPAGAVGQKERNLIILAVALCAIVVIPVFAITIAVAIKYREGNTRSKKYRPDYDHSRVLEFTWWGIPIVLITILAVVAWNSSHSLDPYRALASSKPTMTVQVVSLDWKWLFIYPKQNIASVNYAMIPVNTPVDFQTTSDTVMNSFWVPALGGQIYSMPGMKTQLHLIADKTGSFSGSSANISGQGFAGMTFSIKSGSSAGFNSWVKTARASMRPLNSTSYASLARPSQNVPVSYYSSVSPGLFDGIIMKYMQPMNPAGASPMPMNSGTSSGSMPMNSGSSNSMPMGSGSSMPAMEGM